MDDLPVSQEFRVTLCVKVVQVLMALAAHEFPIFLLSRLFTNLVILLFQSSKDSFLVDVVTLLDMLRHGFLAGDVLVERFRQL